MLMTGVFIGLGCYLALLVFRSFHRIPEGHVGVVERLGAAVRDADGALVLHPPGLHWVLPWLTVRRVSQMEQIIDLSGSEGARTAMAEDGTVLRFDSILRFVPRQDALYQYVFDLRAPREHVTGLFTCLLRNEIACFKPSPGVPAGPESSYASIRRERKKLNAEIMSFCHQEIGAQYGLAFRAVDLVDILPPEELDEALNAVINAQTEAETTYARAEAEAQRRLIAAKKGVEIAATKAGASEREVLTLATQLEALDRAGTLDLYVSRRRAEVLAQSRTHYVRRSAP